YNIGLLHTGINGREGHEPYAPCSIDGLVAKGYDYWALGHIHKREILYENTPIVFPGNLQGRHIRETGEKGCLLVSVQNQQPRKIAFCPLDVLRWERCEVSAANAENAETVVEDVINELRRLHKGCAGRPLAVRVEVRGASCAHEQLLAKPDRWTHEIRSQAHGIERDAIWVEQVKLRTSPPLSASSVPAEGPIGELLSIIEECH